MLILGLQNDEYGRNKGVSVEHYIISSGLKEMIESEEVAEKFTKIYASSFYFDDTGVAVSPAQVVNYTNKTQFLFRIEKGVLDINDQGVNSFFQPNGISCAVQKYDIYRRQRY